MAEVFAGGNRQDRVGEVEMQGLDEQCLTRPECFEVLDLSESARCGELHRSDELRTYRLPGLLDRVECGFVVVPSRTVLVLVDDQLAGTAALDRAEMHRLELHPAAIGLT